MRWLSGLLPWKGGNVHKVSSHIDCRPLYLIKLKWYCGRLCDICIVVQRIDKIELTGNPDTVKLSINICMKYLLRKALIYSVPQTFCLCFDTFKS